MTKLTPREREVFDLLIMGLSNKQVAERLHCSHRTIEDHRKQILKKYEVGNSVLLVRKIFNIAEARP